MPDHEPVTLCQGKTLCLRRLHLDGCDKLLQGLALGQL
jgi:hypothetical protein